ncbi:MAG: DNA polymerase III subunit beta [Alphaproteobacteria bacterium]|nr:MAG: DNA polymerase III subunit beta [Alphaproteobacteria bacterium]
MKITIERGALLKSLSHVQSVVERRNTIPILSNVLIQASGGALSFTATDLDMEIVESLVADVIEEGGTTAPAHTLYDIVRKLPDGSQVQLESGGKDPRLMLRAGRSEFALACLPREDFPVLSAGELPHSFAIEAKELAKLIDKSKFAISMEETRYYLNGIYFHVTDGKSPKLRAVATDGHRLARVETDAPKGSESMPGIIVPRKTVLEISRLIEDGDGPVQVAVSDAKIRFEFDGAVLTSKLIDGTFPDYNRVIPDGNDKVLAVNGKEFSQAVDRVATISTEKSRAVKLNLERGRLGLAVTNPESGNANEEILVDYNADPMEIGFNARYLLDITSQLDGEEARFLLADAGAPTIVRDAKDDAVLYVLMPMRV